MGVPARAFYIRQYCQTIVLSNITDIICAPPLPVKGDAAMASVVSYRDSPAGATPDCFRAYGYSGRDAPACAFECRCVYNSAIHLGRQVVS
jgi:hypothetical protein